MSIFNKIALIALLVTPLTGYATQGLTNQDVYVRCPSNGELDEFYFKKNRQITKGEAFKWFYTETEQNFFGYNNPNTKGEVTFFSGTKENVIRQFTSYINNNKKCFFVHKEKKRL